MKLSQLLVGGAAFAFVAGLGVSAMAADDVTQTFNVTGHVKDTCLMHFSSHSLALGDIVINHDASADPTAYFHMTAAAFEFQTGSGGCNNENDVTITKTNGTEGMHNTTTAQFDPAVFTANIPYEAGVNWTAIGEGGNTPQLLALEAGPTEASASTNGIDHNGAFASAMTVFVSVPVPAKALLAGTYSDTVTVELQTL